MSVDLASRLSSVAPSATLAMAAEAAKLTARGVKVYAFSVGEPDFPTPSHVVEAANKALVDGATRYTAVTGTPDLKAAIVEATRRDRGYTITPDRITVSCGAKHVLFNLATALYEPGDEVIIPAPYWVSYPEQVRMMGATPVIVETTEESGFRMAPDELANAVTPRTKALILCTPSNPTGSAYDEASLAALFEVAAKGSYYVIVDEIYADLVYGGFKLASAGKVGQALGDRLVVVDGVSKTYAMTGWRIGWSISSPALAKALSVIQGQSTTNPAAVSQAAARAALLGPRASVESMRSAFERRRDIMVDGLNALGLACRKPEGAFYAFADVSSLYGLKVKQNDKEKVLETDDDVAMWLLAEAHVATVAGAPFGAPGYLRLSYATSDDDIRAGLASIGAAISKGAR
ncbi:MAG: pyridoxal phosphate-dependent aminotransferase [Polyangiaceae bacterium]|nr:pyridoxal phosphate-dependent aminotransferase [Polyangiaceae bacterium]